MVPRPIPLSCIRAYCHTTLRYIAISSLRTAYNPLLFLRTIFVYLTCYRTCLFPYTPAYPRTYILPYCHAYMLHYTLTYRLVSNPLLLRTYYLSRILAYLVFLLTCIFYCTLAQAHPYILPYCHTVIYFFTYPCLHALTILYLRTYLLTVIPLSSYCLQSFTFLVLTIYVYLLSSLFTCLFLYSRGIHRTYILSYIHATMLTTRQSFTRYLPTILYYLVFFAIFAYLRTYCLTFASNHLLVLVICAYLVFLLTCLSLCTPALVTYLHTALLSYTYAHYTPVSIYVSLQSLSIFTYYLHFLRTCLSICTPAYTLSCYTYLLSYPYTLLHTHPYLRTVSSTFNPYLLLLVIRAYLFSYLHVLSIVPRPYLCPVYRTYCHATMCYNAISIPTCLLTILYLYLLSCFYTPI
jgi:hypothetical protein